MDNLDLDILYAISGDMELTPEPFRFIGEQIGIDESEVIKRIGKMTEDGIIKRIAPILYHHKAKFQFNALTIWSIDQENVDEVADFLMSFQHISHVYERESCPEWPYNLYGMIHAKNPEEIDDTISQILKKTGDVSYKIVYTTKEWKKTSPDLKYLLGKE